MFGRDFIISPFTKTLALLAYLACFFIQLFFNIDVPSNKAQENFYASYFSNTSKSTVQQKQNVAAHTTKSHKHTLRLNKRFYPESLPESVITIAYAPTVKVLSVYFSHYKSPLIQGTYNQKLSLRGPPSNIVA